MVFQAYVTNLGKYNEGHLIGEWVNFPIEEDEFDEVLERIGINEHYEEYFFTDYTYENCPNLKLEEHISHNWLNKIAKKIESFDRCDMEKFNAIVEAWDFNEILCDWDNFDLDNYYLYSDVYNYYDLGYYWIEDSGCYDLKSLGNLANYIDYERFGRDIYYDTCGVFTDYGYIERC